MVKEKGIKLPPCAGEEGSSGAIVKGSQSIVLVGANGAGKTRMSIWIADHNTDMDVHRVSAQKSLNLPESVSPSDIETAEKKFLYGSAGGDVNFLKGRGRENNRWGGKPATHLLDDFRQLMEVLMTDYCDESIRYRREHLVNGNTAFKNETKLEKIQAILEDIVSHRKLNISSGKIEVCGESDGVYNASDMSDGEREMLYFIGEALCAKPDSLIIIDEPETHLHKSILVRLWDAIESCRDDCVFLYITHDLDFAVSRPDSRLVWVRAVHDSANADPAWEYTLLDGSKGRFPDRLRLEIFGSRRKVMLVEGKEGRSIDEKLYSRLYPGYNVMSLDGCDTVIRETKTYNDDKTSGLHYVDVVAVVDRDRRSDEEIRELASHRVYVPDVAEAENLFLLPEVVEIAAKELFLGDKTTEILESMKTKILGFLESHIDEQAYLFAKRRAENEVKMMMDSSKTYDAWAEKTEDMRGSVDIGRRYAEEKERLKKIVEKKDLDAALRSINNKGLLYGRGMLFGLGFDNADNYADYVIRLAGAKNESGEKLREVLRKHVRIPEEDAG